MSATVPAPSHDRGERTPTKTRVTIACGAIVPIEERLNLLTFLMAESLQGATLMSVERWDLTHGCIKFIKESRPGLTIPRGEADIRLEDVDGGGGIVNIHHIT